MLLSSRDSTASNRWRVAACPACSFRRSHCSQSAVLSAGHSNTVRLAGWLAQADSAPAPCLSKAAVVWALLLFGDSVGLAMQRSMWAARCSEHQELARSSTGCALEVPLLDATTLLTRQALLHCPGAVAGADPAVVQSYHLPGIYIHRCRTKS